MNNIINVIILKFVIKYIMFIFLNIIYVLNKYNLYIEFTNIFL